MSHVRDLLHAKGNEVWSISPEASVFDAIKMMAEKHVGALVVVQEGRLVGIVSERDYARKVILRQKSSRSTPVREIMTGRVIYVHPHQEIGDCMALMTDKAIRHLPVLGDDEAVIGIISIGDVVRALLSEREFQIQQLENYITQG